MSGVNWEKIFREMEEYVNSLEGEEEYLKGYEPPEDPDKAKDPKKRKGGSNVGKYSKSAGPFCGPSGGAPRGSFPIGTRRRAISALAYAHHAPNPAGIKRCVCNHWPDLPACKKKKKAKKKKDSFFAAFWRSVPR